MKTRKTKQSEREKFKFDVEKTKNVPEEVVLAAGENGITKEDIALLHRLDDREVESNLRAINPEYSLTKSGLKAHRKRKREFAENWRQLFRAEHGYFPNNAMVDGAVEDEFSSDWTISLDYLMNGDKVTEGLGDKLMELAVFDSYQLEAEKDYQDATDRLAEIADSLSERQKLIYRMVMLEKKTKVATAGEIGISDVMVGREVKKIEKLIREDKILKNFFR